MINGLRLLTVIVLALLLSLPVVVSAAGSDQPDFNKEDSRKQHAASTKQHDAKKPSSKDASVARRNLETCQEKLKKAQELDVLYDVKIDGARVEVFVGPTWFRMPFDAKEGFHQTINCVLTAGEGGAVMTLKYRHWQSGKIVAETAWTGKLKCLNDRRYKWKG